MKETFSATTVAAPRNQSTQHINAVFIAAYEPKLPFYWAISTPEGNIEERKILSWIRKRAEANEGRRESEFCLTNAMIKSHRQGPRLSPLRNDFLGHARSDTAKCLGCSPHPEAEHNQENSKCECKATNPPDQNQRADKRVQKQSDSK